MDRIQSQDSVPDHFLSHFKVKREMEPRLNALANYKVNIN